MFKCIYFFIVSLTLTSMISASYQSPAELKVKVYKFAVSTSEYCTNPTTIISNGSPTYIDVLTQPTYGSGLVDNGTYKCVIIEMDDTIKYTPTINSGGCNVGTEYSYSVCEAGRTSTLVDGTTTTCTTSADRVGLYISTASTKTSVDEGHTPWEPPTSGTESTKGFKLLSELVVSEATTGQFQVDGTDKLVDVGDGCEMYPPIFTFTELN